MGAFLTFVEEKESFITQVFLMKPGLKTQTWTFLEMKYLYLLCRSKLKEKTKKVEMLKLKKSLALDSSHGRCAKETIS